MPEPTPIEAIPVEEHKEAVAEATAEERERARDERVAALEARINSLDKPAAPAPTEPTEPAAPLSAVESLTEKVEGIAATAATPVAAVAEPIADVAGAVVDTTLDAAEATEEVIEDLPRRTHSLFRPLFGKGRD